MHAGHGELRTTEVKQSVRVFFDPCAVSACLQDLRALGSMASFTYVARGLHERVLARRLYWFAGDESIEFAWRSHDQQCLITNNAVWFAGYGCIESVWSRDLECTEEYTVMSELQWFAGDEWSHPSSIKICRTLKDHTDLGNGAREWNKRARRVWWQRHCHGCPHLVFALEIVLWSWSDLFPRISSCMLLRNHGILTPHSTMIKLRSIIRWNKQKS